METLRNITLKVEISAGTSIEAATSELCELSNRLGVFVEADFNGVCLMASPDSDSNILVNQYHSELNNGCAVKIAFGD